MHRLIQATAKATFVTLGILSIAAPIFASEQDTCPLSWRPDRLPGVGSGQVLASTTWDPDGAGPLPPRLVLDGNFLVAGNTPTVAVASWDGTSWQAMPSGFPISEAAYALTVHNGDLIVIGGSFLTAGDAVTPNLARFGPSTELPAIAQQPAPANVLAGNNANFHVATFGGQPQTYQWRKNGANLADDPHITGALTDTLTISPAAMPDAGLYDCLINNACGEVTSNQARLTLIGQIQTFKPAQPSGPANPG